MAKFFSVNTGLDRSHYTIAISGKKISISDCIITPFDAPHSEVRPDGTINKVISTGYFVETAESSYLFPCDVRTYDPDCLKPFIHASTVFAHVFLGRSAALSPEPPLLDAFVRFYLSCHPEKIILTHLYELGRDAEDCWLTSHAKTAARAFSKADKKVKVVIPDWYKEIIL